MQYETGKILYDKDTFNQCKNIFEEIKKLCASKKKSSEIIEEMEALSLGQHHALSTI